MEKTVARSIIYDFLAKGFLYPDDATRDMFTDPEFRGNLKDAIQLLRGKEPSPAEETIDRGFEDLGKIGLDGLAKEYENLFGIQSRKVKVVLNQTEVVPLKPGFPVLTSVHGLSDLLGFYRAFGFEAPGVRADHFGVELEFMYVLTFKEFQARREGSQDKVGICEKAEKKFLEDYLALSGPLFAQGLRQATERAYFRLLAEVFLWFMEWESREFEIVFPQEEDGIEEGVPVGVSLEDGGDDPSGLKGAGCGSDCFSQQEILGK